MCYYRLISIEEDIDPWKFIEAPGAVDCCVGGFALQAECSWFVYTAFKLSSTFLWYYELSQKNSATAGMVPGGRQSKNNAVCVNIVQG